MKHPSILRRVSPALLVLLMVGIQIISAAAESKMSQPKGSSSSKKLQSDTHLKQVKPDSRASKSTEHQVAVMQPVADKKQAMLDDNEAQESSAVAAASGSARGSSSSASGANNAVEEYVQIKPEEINVNEQGKEIDSSASQASGAGDQRPEHKSSVDDELNAHLASDVIHQQESAHRAYSAPAPRASGSYQSPPRPGRAVGYPAPVPRPAPYKLMGAIQVPRARPQRPFPSGPREPPHYIALKGKLTGINSIISQYPHPAPGYPHQGPRHLPRGAAAGYAAFRDFVRAHASKYKHSGPAQTGPPSSPYAAPEVVGYQRKPMAPAAPPPPPPSMGGPSYASMGKQQQTRTKVTVAQAYIPHLSPNAQQGSSGYGAHQSSYMSPYTNPILSKLYGGHAPQGAGRPEYNRDYGMVIHYPQATVYTEPMSVDQLYKLTGGGISQVIEQLQYNLAHGHRDEASMIRANNKHHIGNGVTIHAKEYYAPGKHGQYLPTTAAVITTGNSQKGAYSASEPAPAGPYGEQAPGAELGSGYERVKEAVAQGQQARYNNLNKQPSEYQEPAGKYDTPSGGQAPVESTKYNGGAMSALGGLLDGELESLYKANNVLNKQLDPEIHAQIQAYLKNSNSAHKPLKYADLSSKSPLMLHVNGARPEGEYAQGPQQSQHGPRGYMPPMRQGHRNGPQRGYRKGQNPRSNRYSHRPQPNQFYGPPQGPYQQRPQPRPQQPSGYGVPQQQHQASQQQQLKAYQAAEQALNQQMSQLLQEFHHGEEQYNARSPPVHPSSQGYPEKVLQQKYQQQQQQQQQQRPQSYNLHEGLEIPQGPNDQVGEIAELLEALKGSLELNGQMEQQSSYGATNKQQSGELTKDVRYLASALGQTPTYAMQVPVTSAAPATDAGAYQNDKRAAEPYKQQQQQSYGSYQQPSGSYQQPARSYQQTAGSYQQSSGAYQAATGSYQQPAGAYQQQSGAEQQSAAYQGPAKQEAFQPVDSYAQSQPSSQAGNQQPEGAYGAGQSEYSASQNGDYLQQSGAPNDYAPQEQQQSQRQPQQHSQQAIVGNPQAGGYGGPGQSGAYQQAAAPASVEPVGNQNSAYSTSEHSQVINHLVPASQAPSGPAGVGYESGSASSAGQAATSDTQQPANQIAVAAPTDSQYQNAQSLSSFVDSLPTDYQELLRQPALNSTPHLAALAHESSTANTTSPQAYAAGHSNSQQAQQQQEDTSGQHQDQLQSAYQQQAQQAGSLTDPGQSTAEPQQGQQVQYGRKA